MAVLITRGDGVPLVMAVGSCICDVGGHCRPHTMVRKEQMADFVLVNCENRVFVSYVASLRNYLDSVRVISISGRVLGVSVARGLLVVLNRSVLYTLFYVSLCDGGIVTIRALLVLSSLSTVRFSARLDSSVRISSKKRKY